MNLWIEEITKDRDNTKYQMVLCVMDKLFKAVTKGCYVIEEDLLKGINYSEICEWMGWPDLQDGGLFEQTIDTAVNAVLGIFGYKPIRK